MYSWGKKIAVCVLLVASIVFLQTSANASSSVYLSGFDSGLVSTDKIYGNDVSPKIVFGIEEGRTVNVPGNYMNLSSDSALRSPVLPQIAPPRVPTPVPIPGALWLLGSGLAGLVGIKRRFAK